MKRINTLIAAAGLLALAACGGGDTESGNAAGGGTAESAASGGGGGEAVRLEPGQWEMSFEVTEVSAPGMPEGAADMMKTPRQTVKSCVSEEEANKPDADFFQPKQESNCKTEGFAMKDGRINGTVTCQGTGGQGATKVTMDGTYGGTAFDMTSRTEMKGEGMEMTMVMKSAGRRIGECPAGAEKEDMLEDNLGRKRVGG